MSLVIAIVGQLLAVVAVLGADQPTPVPAIIVAIVVPAILLTISVLVRTHYTVAGDTLRIVCGPFRWSVPISEISEVVDSRSPLSSPALSLDRLKISYGHNKHILISPDDRNGFLRAIGRSPD